MADTKYAYAVARIRSMELSLFSGAVIEQLVACKDYRQCLQFLVEKGWGDSDTPLDADAILTRESEKTWEVIRELKVDMSAFAVLSYQKLFHNLKAAVKEVCTSEVNAHIFFEDCEPGREEMLRIIRHCRSTCGKRRRKLMRRFFIPETVSFAILLWTERRWKRFRKQERLPERRL